MASLGSRGRAFARRPAAAAPRRGLAATARASNVSTPQPRPPRRPRAAARAQGGALPTTKGSPAPHVPALRPARALGGAPGVPVVPVVPRPAPIYF